MSQKSYDNSPSLYLIPTPIGNMDDITLRSINTLKEVDYIFCEDTRETGKLLKYLNIEKKLISNHNYNESANIETLIALLNDGHNIGLVSDRGTPIISDPGYELVRAAIINNFNVIALPGPSALIPALIVSGIESMPFLFYGFLNNKEERQKSELEQLKCLEYTLIFYESPHRILRTLSNMLLVFGNRQISISREISKKYEEIYRGTIAEVIDKLINIKGELVIVVEKNKLVNNYDNLTIVEHVNLYIKEGNNLKESMKKVAVDRKVSKKEIYNEYHNIE